MDTNFLPAQTTHKCIADSLKANCPICFEFMFTSVMPISFMPCGHAIHSECLGSLLKTGYESGVLTLGKCPLCQKAVSEKQLEFYNNTLDEVIPTHPMPEQYKKTVHVLCNQCDSKSAVPFHFYGMKCKYCGNYNTSLINGEDDVHQKPILLGTTDTDSDDDNPPSPGSPD